MLNNLILIVILKNIVHGVENRKRAIKYQSINK